MINWENKSQDIKVNDSLSAKDCQLVIENKNLKLQINSLKKQNKILENDITYLKKNQNQTLAIENNEQKKNIDFFKKENEIL